MNKIFNYIFFLENLIIIYIFLKSNFKKIRKKKLISKRRKFNLLNNRFLNKLFNNKEILNLSKNRESYTDIILNNIENINLNNIYKKVYILKNTISKKICSWIIYEAEKYAEEFNWK